MEDFKMWDRDNKILKFNQHLEKEKILEKISFSEIFSFQKRNEK